jgi:hypothetical protein
MNQLAKLRFIGYYACARNNPLRDGSRSGGMTSSSFRKGF